MSVEFGKEFRISAAITDPAIKRQLLAMEMNGNESVNSGFVSPNAHNIAGRREAEKAEASDIAMQFLVQIEKEVQERIDAINDRIEELDRASLEALRENAKELEKAEIALQEIRAQAHQITRADGTTIKVYRDGDLVRSDNGDIVDPSLISPSDIPSNKPIWSLRQEAGKRVGGLLDQQGKIMDFRDRLESARDRANSNPSSSDLDDLELDLADMPDAVRGQVKVGEDGPVRATSVAKEHTGSAFDNKPPVLDSFASAVIGPDTTPDLPAPSGTVFEEKFTR